MAIPGISLSRQVQERAAFVASLSPQDKTIAALCQQTVQDLETEQDPTATLNSLQVLQRLYIAGKIGVLDDPSLTEALTDPRFITYKDYAVLPTTEEKQDALVKAMYEGDPENRQPILLMVGDYGRGLGEKTLQCAIDDKAIVNPWIFDPLFHRRLLSVCDDAQAKHYGQLEGEYYLGMERRLEYRVGGPSVPFVDPPSPDKNTIQNKMMADTRRPAHTDMFYTLTLLPTEENARQDNMTYQELIDIYFDMSDLDW